MDNFLISKKAVSESTTIDLGKIKIGSKNFTIIAGPCAVESEVQLFKIANMLKKSGVNIIRASLFKPRTSPYSFQGVGLKGLKILEKLKEKTGLIIETEIMDTNVDLIAEKVDIVRIGSRNMHNFELLKKVGQLSKPVILKRGMSATIEEFLMAAEYILKEGNTQVILCERGIRTFETKTRFTLDLSAIPVIKELSHLPIIVDPSHSSGKSSLVPAVSKAALAVGADGLLIEVHSNPEKALSDNLQQLNPNQFSKLMQELKPMAKFFKRTIN